MQFHSRIYPSTVNKKNERSDLENIKQKNDRYSKFDQYKFYENFQTKNDLQGWRNKLIDLIPKKNQNINIADLGCGLGDKALRLIKNINKQFSKLYLIDYAVNSTKIFEDIYKDNKVKIFHLDVVSALNKIEDKSLDVIIAFGFIHEIGDKESFFLKIKEKIHKKSLIIISDNDHYFSAEELSIELEKCEIFNCTFKKIFKFLNFHIYYRINDKTNCSKFLIFYHDGRSDNIISIPDTLSNELKRFNYG